MKKSLSEKVKELKFPSISWTEAMFIAGFSICVGTASGLITFAIITLLMK